jgi:uncharacterized protein YjbJ (UPF0337 family)
MSDTYTHKQPNGQEPNSGDRRADFAGQAKEFGRDVKNKASELTDTVTQAAKEQASQLGSAAKNLAENAKGKAEDAVNQQKSAGADYIGSIAQAVGRAASEFDNEIPQVAHYIRAASDQIQNVANTVRERDVKELVGEVQEFARRQPAIFFGGAVIVGFAALRFLKSSAPQSGRSGMSEDRFASPSSPSYSGSSSSSYRNAFEQKRAG